MSTLGQAAAVTIQAFGGICDGISHPLSNYYSTLALAQSDYPFVTSLTQELDYVSAQVAFDYAFKNNLPINIIGQCYLGADTIILNKDMSDRKPFYISGGGTFFKNITGFMFAPPSTITATTPIADIFIDSVLFKGVHNQAIKVFDCSQAKIISITTTNCFHLRLDTVFYSDIYMQSIKSISCKYVEIDKAVFDLQGIYDIVVSNALMETSVGSFLIHGGNCADSGIYGLRIRNGVFEGSTGTSPVFSLKDCDSLVIDGCYFEANTGGHIVFASNSTLNNVSIENCSHNGPADVAHLIVWGKNINGCFSHSNTCHNIGVHDMVNNTNGGKLISINDRILWNGSDNDCGFINYTKSI